MRRNISPQRTDLTDKIFISNVYDAPNFIILGLM